MHSSVNNGITAKDKHIKHKTHKRLKTALKIICLMISLFCTLLCVQQWKVYAVKDDTNSGQATDYNDDTDDISKDTSPFSLGVELDTENDDGTFTGTLQILLILTVISLAPSILIMVTSFTRIIIVLHFVRQALGTATSPPNQILVGLALFLTVFIMSPVINKVYNDAIKPLEAGEITTEQALEVGMEPIREFMLDNVNKKDLKMFIKISDTKVEDSYDDIPTTTLIPAFILSELRAAFIIGFLIYIPFIVIDMIVASTLMSMGMMMLPPTTISAPFKILLFILADGWNLVIGNLVQTFH